MDDDDYEVDNYNDEIDDVEVEDENSYLEQENAEEHQFNIISYNDIIKNINTKEKKTIPYLFKYNNWLMVQNLKLIQKIYMILMKLFWKN